jgi:hypothetical protein
MLNMRILRRVVVALVLFSSTAVAAAADDRTAAAFLPPSTVVYAEIRQPQELLNTVYDHKLVRHIEELDQVRSAMEKKGYLDFKAGVAIVESQMGLPWRKIVGQTMGGGIVIALDAKTQGVAILARATDATTQSKLIETLVNLASLDAKNKGTPNPVKTSDYRGIKIYGTDKFQIAATADWLVMTNKDELRKKIVDSFLDKPKESLAADAQFGKAHNAVSASTTAWGYVSTAALRDAGVAKKLYSGQADNVVAELIFGGILSTLQQTPYVTVGLDVSDRQVRLSASAPHDRSWAGESREYYFGPRGKGVAPSRLLGEDTIVSLSTYRDVSAMWQRAGDLLNEQANEELAKADSGLTTFFGGKDFGEDILGALRPGIQLVVTRQEFAAGQSTPAIKLPAFGLVADLKDPVKMQPELRRTFQNLVGFLNVVGAMNGQPQLDLDMEKTEAAQFVTASYLPDPKAKDQLGSKINFNFSPSIAFTGSRFVVASTTAMAHTLATANSTNRPPDDAAPVVNTDAVLHFGALRDILTDNRQQLIAQNILTAGHSKTEAEREISTVLDLIGWFDRMLVTLDTTSSELHVSLEVALKQVD